MNSRLARVATATLACCLILSGVAQEPPVFQLQHVLTISEEEPVLTATLSADGRLAYAVPKTIERSEVRIRGAEVYVMGVTGKDKKRLLRADAFGDPDNPMRLVSFRVARLAWSPDGTKLAVEISRPQAPAAAFFFKSTGGDLRLPSGQSFVLGYDATWLADSSSVAILSEAAAPRLLHRVAIVRMEAGRLIPLFRQQVFAAVAWLPGKMQAVLVLRDEKFAEPPRLTVGDLNSGELRELGPEPDFLGGLRAAPDGEHFSYFAGQRKLVRRSLTGEVAGTYALPFSAYEWLPGGSLLFLEPEKPGYETGWLATWNLQTNVSERLLPDERIRRFWVSPEGSQVAVLTAEDIPALKVYRLKRNRQ